MVSRVSPNWSMAACINEIWTGSELGLDFYPLWLRGVARDAASPGSEARHQGRQADADRCKREDACLRGHVQSRLHGSLSRPFPALADAAESEARLRRRLDGRDHHLR